MPTDKPGPNAGIISPLTQYLRGEMPLTEGERKHARFLRFECGWEWLAIAEAIGHTEEEVRHALANARTPSINPSRRTMNVSLAAHAKVKSQQMPDEAIWETVNRILGVEAE